MLRKNIFDAVIIGGGCAGTGAALRLREYSRNVLVVERKRIGGLIYYAHRVSNMPFLKNETGISVCRRMECLLKDSGLPVLFTEVIDVKKTLKGLVKLRTSEGDIIARYVLFATGRMPVKHEKESERIKYFHDEIKEGETAVIGGGEVAVSQAISLKHRGLTADIFTRSGLKNVNLQLEREAYTENIKIIHAGESLKSDESFDKVTVAYKANGAEIILSYDNLLYCCGREPVMPETDFNLNDEQVSSAGTVKKEFPSQCDYAFKDGAAEGMKIGFKLRSKNECDIKK